MAHALISAVLVLACGADGAGIRLLAAADRDGFSAVIGPVPARRADLAREALGCAWRRGEAPDLARCARQLVLLFGEGTRKACLAVEALPRSVVARLALFVRHNVCARTAVWLGHCHEHRDRDQRELHGRRRRRESDLNKSEFVKRPDFFLIANS